MPRKISAGAIVFRRTKRGLEFLLLQHELGHWEFPKGKIEDGEEELETVRREIEEETSIARIEFVEDFREIIQYSYRRKRKSVSKTVTFHLVKTRQQRVKLSDEHQDFQWLPYDRALRKLTFNNSKAVLGKAMKVLREME